MKLQLIRHNLTPEYTEGNLFIDGDLFCQTIEDTVRDGEKVYGQTAIPAGTYDVVLTMSPRLGKVTPRLLNVPRFEGVLIHSGNTAKDTEGCLLVGKYSSPGVISDSRNTWAKLMEHLNDAVENKKEKCTIEIKNP